MRGSGRCAFAASALLAREITARKKDSGSTESETTMFKTAPTPPFLSHTPHPPSPAHEVMAAAGGAAGVTTRAGLMVQAMAVVASEVPKDQCRDSGLEEEEQHRNPFLSTVGDVRISSSLLAPKPQFRYEVSVARWDEEMRLGEIIKMKGSIWTSMGVTRNGGKLYCTIEEILFLVERGALHLLNGKDVVLSLNDIYKKVSEGKSGCSWECFVVYRHLKSLGYIVRRHGLPWALKSEMNRCFDTPLSSNSLFAKLYDNEKSNGEVVSDVHITRLFEAMQINALKLDFDVFLPNSKFKKASPGNPNFVLSLISEKPPTRREVEDLERQCSHVPLKFCNVDHGRVSFYSFDKIDLPVLL